MKKILIVSIFLIALSGISSADIIYTTTDGKLGLVKIAGSQSLDLAGVQYDTGKENPILESYWDNNKSRVMLIERDGSSYDRAIRFNSSNLIEAIDKEPVILNEAKNTTKILSTITGEGIILIHGATVQEFTTDDLAPTTRKYTYPTKVDIKDATIIGRRIFVLVDNALLKFDGQIKEKSGIFSSWDVEPGAEAMAFIGDGTLVIGHEKGIQVLSSSMEDLLETKPVKALCSDGSYGFYFVTQELSGDVYHNMLCHFNGATTNEILNFEGKHTGLMCETYNHVLALIANDKILLYDTSDGGTTFVTEYDKSALGGSPFRLATNTSSGQNYEESKGSCNNSNLGILLLVLSFCFVIIKLNHNFNL